MIQVLVANKTAITVATVRIVLFCVLLLIVALCIRVLVTIDRLSNLGLQVSTVAEDEIEKSKLHGSLNELASQLGSAILEQQDYGAVVEKLNRTIDALLDQHRRAHEPIHTSEEAALLDDLDRGFKLLLQTGNEIVASRGQHETQDIALQLRGAWKSHRHVIQQTIDRITELEANKVAAAAALNAEKIRSARSASLTLALLSILLSLTFAMVTGFYFSRAVSAADRIIKRIQGQVPIKSAEISRGIVHDPVSAGVEAVLDARHRTFEEMCHEIRTPLTALRGEAEVALRGPEKSAAEYRETLKVTSEVTEQLEKLVNDLMFLSRSDVGQIEYNIETVSVSSILDTVVRHNQGTASLRGIQLERDAVSAAHPEDAALVCGDPLRLKELFGILVDNALKYTSAGGKVSVALETEKDKVRVLITDTGMGIREDDIPHIFGRFYRGKVIRTQDTDGAGLGLSVAKSIIHVHGGEISVTSEIGNGTTIVVSLPRLQSEKRALRRAS